MKAKRLFLLLSGILLTCGAIHADNTWFQQSRNFSAYSLGQGKVHFKVLVFARGTTNNHWAKNGDESKGELSTIYGIVDGREIKILTYYGDNSKNCDNKYKGWAWVAVHDGTAVITNTYDKVPVNMTEGQRWEFWLSRTGESDTPTFLEFDWYPSSLFDGKQFSTKAHIVDTRKFNDISKRDWNLGTYSAQSVQAPMLFDPVFYSVGENGVAGLGHAMIPYVVYQDPISYYTSYTSPSEAVQTTDRSGQLFVMTTDTVQQDYNVTFTVKRDGGQVQKVTSNTIKIPAFHRIYNLRLLHYTYPDGRINTRYTVLKWEMHTPEAADLMPNDMFQIQRAYHSDFSDAQTLGIVPMVFDSVHRTYTYVDSTAGALYNPVDRSQPIYYRVNRTSTTNWGYKGHSWVAQDWIMKQPTLLTLLSDSTYYRKAKDFNRTRRIAVTITTQKMGLTTFWDPNAAVIIRRMAVMGNDTVISERMVGGGQFRIQADSTYRAEVEMTAEVPCAHYTYTTEVSDANSDLKCGTVTPIRIDGEDLYYTNAASVASFSVSKGYYPDGVFMQWNQTEGNADVFRIERRMTADNGVWSHVADVVGEHYYRDHTAQSGTTYDYRIICSYSCNGVTLQDTATDMGWLSPVGSIDGRISYPNGTGNANVEVRAIAQGGEKSFLRGYLLSRQPDAVFATTAPISWRGSHTYQLWVKTEASNSTQDHCLLSNRKGVSLSLTEQNRRLTFRYGTQTAQADIVMTAGQWTALAVRYDAEKQVATLYQDGKVLYRTEMQAMDVPDDCLYLSDGTEGTGIDEVRIWDRALTDQEIAGNTHAYLSGKEAGLAYYYTFDAAPAYHGGTDGHYVSNMAYSDTGYAQRTDMIIGEQGEIVTNDAPGSELLHYKALSDESGNYRIGGIPFAEGTTYNVTPTAEHGTFSYNGTSAGFAAVTLSQERPEVTGIDFVNTEAVRFTGRVLYRRSTIPVRGARFLVNGVQATDAAGNPIETNAAGNFEFEVPKAPVTVQVVMDKHRFAGDGFFFVDGDSLFTPTANMDGLRMWDETKVRLIGRIAGGNDQGSLPVGFSLSKNNLGDSILMVLELEGDNTAQIVYDPQDKTLDRIDTMVTHAVGGCHTEVVYRQKRICIYPDPKTGEFAADLFPVKYKLPQLTAQGYSTLTNGNTGMQVIDLTNRLTSDTLRNNGVEVVYNDTFRHVYHSPVSISLRQLQYGMEQGYLGIEKTYLTDFDSVAHIQDVVCKNALGEYEYLFGKPVFNEGKYSFRITAHEDYYYNGNRTQGVHDQVMLHGGKIQIYNGMHSEKEILSGELDANGQMQTVLQADYPTYTRLGDDALRRIVVSVEHNGEYVQSEPVEVYVFADRLSGVESVNITPAGLRLYDVLRDPPGSGSYSSLSAGSIYQQSGKYHLSVEAGIKLGMAFGSNYTGIVGVVAAPAGAGTFTGTEIQTSSATPVTIPILFNGVFDWSDQYRYTTSDAIRTSSDAYHVGAEADIYIGATENVYHGIGHGMTVLDSTAYAAMSAQVKNGTMKLIASARNTEGQMRYLVVARKLLYAFDRGTTFAYTQDHILTTIIPTLLRERNNLILTTDPQTAQRQADYTKQRVYYTALAPADSRFGTKDTYHWADPQDTRLLSSSDTIAALNRMIRQWMELIALNEKQKVQAVNTNQVFKTYSITGNVPVTHSETMEYSSSSSMQFATPGNLFSSVETVASLSKVFGAGAQQIINLLNVTQQEDEDGNSKNSVEIEANTTGSKFKLSFNWVNNISFNHVDGKSESASRTYSYTLSPDAYGYMDVNVYRTKDTINSFNKETGSPYEYSSFIFYELAGASRCPYEGGDSTLFYNAGTPLGNPTIAIENPHITVAKREISSVPADQKAVFDIALSNEQPTDIGYAASAIPFELSVVPASNPNGLKLSIDGVPLGFSAMKIAIPHGVTVHKKLEVERGQGYDFENIRLRLRSTCDIDEYDEAAVSVHFVPAATALNLSAPHDKWVLNTQSSHDSAGYYLPVVIDGFDVHSDGFDHIELQYKQLNQSDNDWVNLCSYYADDSLYAQASGNKAMIDNGKIDNVRFYGERDPMEQNYDLRAVSFARYGNGFVSRSSAVLHGTKDTRRPEVFGTPTPADGVLGVKDVLSVRFSEPIAGNYLDEDANFEVVGGTNGLDITQTTSLAFSGEVGCMAKTQVHRNMSNRTFTIEAMIRPAGQGKAMTIFALGDTKQKLRFSLTEDNRLRAEAGKVSVTSGRMEPIQDFTRCAMTYDTTGTVHFYAGTKDITLPDQPVLPRYMGNGTLLFGNTESSEEPFHGNMLEARLWTKVLTQDELSLYYKKHLTGYERELMAYYPMNEGIGSTCHDAANGATLMLKGTSWTLPDGMSLHLTQGDGVRLNQDVFARSAIQDLTLMLWFKTDEQTPDTAALFATGGGLMEEDDAEGKVFIGLQNGNVVLRHKSRTYTARGHYADQTWHHLTYTVNRTYNIASLFVDGKLSVTLAADRIGSMSSNEMWLGACHWTLCDTLGNRKQQPQYPFSGHIDHVVLYEQALPNSSIQNYHNIAPSGEEMGLVAYLPFCAQQLSDNGRLELRYSPYNARVFRDAGGQVVDKKQLLLLTDASTLTDKSDFAPVREAARRTKYNFSWACNGDELMLNLKMPDKEINKQNIFLTVRNAEDLNGNRMLNPMSWTVFVDRNQLRWSESEKTVRTPLNSASAFDLTISNTGGSTRQYQLTSLPAWLTAVPASGTLAPQASQTIHFTVAEGLNIGEHTEYIYLQDDQDLFERLVLTVNVESVCPWADDYKDLPLSMSLIGQVLLANTNDTTYDTDTNDVIAAFVNDRCVGTAHITYDDATLANHVYMTIYGDTDYEGETIRLRLWQASTGKIYILDSPRAIRFYRRACYGCSPDAPIPLTTSERKVQQLILANGWNWISFYLNPAYRTDINQLLTKQAGWTAGDIIKDPNSSRYAQYANPSAKRAAGWYGSLTQVDYRHIYMTYTANDVELEVEGNALNTDEQRTIMLNRGWCNVPYLLSVNMPLAEALSDYYANAQTGDLIKNKDCFAVFTAAGKWEGNLTYMQPGVGYMMRRTGAPCRMTYYEYNTAHPKRIQQAAVSDSAPLFANHAASNMSVIASVDLSTLTDGNDMRDLTLSAYMGNTLVGRVAPQTTESSKTPLFFLTAGSDDAGVIRFVLERNGQPIAHTAPLLPYHTNDIVGSVEQPFPIVFGTRHVTATPTPFTDYVLFSVTAEADATVDITVYGTGGQLLTTASLTAPAVADRAGTLYTYRWNDLSHMPSGVYTAIIRINGDLYPVKLIKQ